MKAEWTNKDVLTQSETTGQSKAILILDVPEKIVGKVGTKLRIVGEEYNVDWKLRPLPEKSGLVHQDTEGWCELSEYSRGWNDCLDKIFGD